MKNIHTDILIYIEKLKEYINNSDEVKKYFIGDKMGLPEPFIEHFSYMWHNPPLKYKPIKKKPISTTHLKIEN